jgi:hypothetical protein
VSFWPNGGANETYLSGWHAGRGHLLERGPLRVMEYGDRQRKERSLLTYVFSRSEKISLLLACHCKKVNSEGVGGTSLPHNAAVKV